MIGQALLAVCESSAAVVGHAAGAVVAFALRPARSESFMRPREVDLLVQSGLIRR